MESFAFKDGRNNKMLMGVTHQREKLTTGENRTDCWSSFCDRWAGTGQAGSVPPRGGKCYIRSRRRENNSVWGQRHSRIPSWGLLHPQRERNQGQLRGMGVGCGRFKREGMNSHWQRRVWEKQVARESSTTASSTKVALEVQGHELKVSQGSKSHCSFWANSPAQVWAWKQMESWI